MNQILGINDSGVAVGFPVAAHLLQQRSVGLQRVGEFGAGDAENDFANFFGQLQRRIGCRIFAFVLVDQAEIVESLG